MNKSTSSYDQLTRFYDVMYAGRDNDTKFYVEEAKRNKTPALEIGCGTGRILIEVAKAGVSVDGIDVSTSSLEICQKKLDQLPEGTKANTCITAADMRNFKLPKQFGFIYLPFRTFLAMHTVEDQIQALRNCHDHLLSDGRLVLDFFVADYKSLAMGTGDFQGIPRWVGEYAFPDNQRTLTVWICSLYNPVAQLVDHRFTFEILDENKIMVERSYADLQVRWIHRYEFEHLLHRCGFDVESLYATFDRQPVTAQSQNLIWIARKAH